MTDLCHTSTAAETAPGDPASGSVTGPADELAREQAYIRMAYDCLDGMRASARQLQYSVESGAGGTHQARFERDVVEERAMERLARLQLGTESLVFGRIDRRGTDAAAGERFYIGRLPVSDREQNPVVVDWRAPVAEAFYRATGANPLGLERRRHFATNGAELLGMDDEVFTIQALERDGGRELVGSGALLAALGRARSGTMRDIVATIQREQDEIIRSDQSGVIVVQGGPGTGKTAVALHRAAYLLYTFRFPLERQGVLVVGPNRLFMRYIARVLPSLGETGVELSSVDDLFHEVTASGTDTHAAARVKGDVRMAKVIRRAVTTRERPLREDLLVGFGLVRLRVTVDESVEMVNSVKRTHRLHNPSRKQLAALLHQQLYRRYREAMARAGRTTDDSVVAFEDFAATMRKDESVRSALERMWPLLTPQMLLRDLYGAPALVRAAARDILSDDEQRSLQRGRGESLDEVAWTSGDVALLDEAAVLLGPLEKKATLLHNGHDAPHVHPQDEGMRTYGHIVVDEAQDLSPMQLRMLSRRSLSGSMTIVGDIGQATGMWAPKSWSDVLAHLPKRRGNHQVELTVGYRTPSEIMALAARVLAVAAPNLTVPSCVRSAGREPLVLRAPGEDAVGGVEAGVRAVQERLGGPGSIGIIAPDPLVARITAALQGAGISLDPAGAIGDGVSVLPATSVKGLEFDGVVVVEPARIVRDAAQGLRALFVALTRATRDLAVVHAEPLPPCMA